MFWAVVASIAPGLLYALHRWCLKLEEQGYLYYLHKKPSSGGSVLNPLQEIVQPQIRYVLEIHDELPIKSEDDRGEGKEPNRIVRSTQNPGASA